MQTRRTRRVCAINRLRRFLYINGRLIPLLFISGTNKSGLIVMYGDIRDKILGKHKRKIRYVGRQHPVIHLIRKIRNNAHDGSERLFAAEGLWAHKLLIETGSAIRCVVICPELLYSAEALELAESCLDKASAAYIVSGKLFKKISERDGPDGLISLVQLPVYKPESLQIKEKALIVVLDGLENPGNIGTILRTCDGAGADAVFICNRKARMTNPKLIKSSMGAVFTVPVIEFDDTELCIDWLKARNFSIYLADAKAGRTYRDFDYTGNIALVMGSERYGISKKWYSCDPQPISIPMRGICDSLNVGVAASVIIYEISMKRLQKGYGANNGIYEKSVQGRRLYQDKGFSEVHSI